MGADKYPAGANLLLTEAGKDKVGHISMRRSHDKKSSFALSSELCSPFSDTLSVHASILGFSSQVQYWEKLCDCNGLAKGPDKEFFSFELDSGRTFYLLNNLVQLGHVERAN